MQVGLFSYAWYCGLTRVSDYKHHPTDVLAGGVLGSIVAVSVALVTRSVERGDRGEKPDVRDRLLTETGEL